MVIILLTQSMGFLELVMESGASGAAFWGLAIMTLPRFMEVILPVALMAAIVFIYNRLAIDSELAVMRALGISPRQLARPALHLALAATMILWFMTMWLAPVSLTGMNKMRVAIKTQYSALLFREGVFNSIGKGVTVFMRERAPNGELHGLIIHDARDKEHPPVTITAKRGQIVATKDGQRVLVHDGTRQDIDSRTGVLNRLEFERYTVDLPEDTGPVHQRWREPDERTLKELFNPDLNDIDDRTRRADFMLEAHRRLVSPLLAPAFAAVALAFLLLGSMDRRGQGWRIMWCVGIIIAIQMAYMAAFSFSHKSTLGLVLMYATVFIPMITGLWLLRGGHEIFTGRRAVRENAGES